MFFVKIETLFSSQTYVVTQAVYLSGPYRKIRTAQGANQNAPFQRGPVQLYNNSHLLTSTINLSDHICREDYRQTIKHAARDGGAS